MIPGLIVLALTTRSAKIIDAKQIKDKKMNEKIIILAKRGLGELGYLDFIKKNTDKLLIIQAASGENRALETESLSLPIFNVLDYAENKNIELLIEKLSMEHQVTALCAASESDILRAAYWREKFEIPGQSMACAHFYRDKIDMKKCLQKSGITVPEYQRAMSMKDVVSFSLVHGYPFVIKPAQGGGSQDTFIIHTSDGFDTFKGIVRKDYFSCPGGIDVEKFINGTMYHVDGLIHQHHVVFSWPSQYINQSVDLEEGKWIGSVLLNATNPLTQRLQSYAEQVVAALPNSQGSAFHLEVFIEDESGKIILCEIASRPGGSLIRPLWHKVFGIDLLEEHLILQSGYQPRTYPYIPQTYGGLVVLGAPKGKKLVSQETPQDPSIFLTDMWWKPGDRIIGEAQGLGNAMAQLGFTALDEKNAMQQVHSLAQWVSAHTFWGV